MKLKILYNISKWDNLGLNYWGITKCGNTSIKYALIQTSKAPIAYSKKDKFGADSWVHNEDNASYIDIDTALSNGHRNFTVVRNPYDRFISMFKDTQRRHDHFFRKNRNVKIKTIDDLISFIENTPDEIREVHFRSQSSFISRHDVVLPEFVFDITNTVKIQEFLNVRMSHMNLIKSDTQLTPSQKKRIYDIYQKDFKLLGYEK
jgi:hypothetical protein